MTVTGSIQSQRGQNWTGIESDPDAASVQLGTSRNFTAATFFCKLGVETPRRVVRTFIDEGEGPVCA